MPTRTCSAHTPRSIPPAPMLTIMVLNKDPANSAQVTFTTTGFTPTNMNDLHFVAIVAFVNCGWIVESVVVDHDIRALYRDFDGGQRQHGQHSGLGMGPGSGHDDGGGEWNQHAASDLITGAANVALSAAAFDSFEGAPACTGGTITLTTPLITTGAQGEITVNAGSTPGFCHFTVTGDARHGNPDRRWMDRGGQPGGDSGQNGGDGQTGSKGAALPTPLAVTLTPDPSGGKNAGASVLFTASAGSLSNGTTSGSKVIAVTNSSGVARSRSRCHQLLKV